MNMEEKIMRTLEAMEHPESFSKEELHHLLNDPECVAIARDILDSREALARRHAPAPDVDAEWESFKRRSVLTQTSKRFTSNAEAFRWGAALLVAASLALLFLSRLRRNMSFSKLHKWHKSSRWKPTMASIP